MPSPNPYERTNIFWEHATSTKTGLLLGVALSLAPGIKDLDFPVFTYYLDQLELPRWMLSSVLSVLIGYTSAKTLNCLRWKIVTYLLTYQGWMTSPGSRKSKTWMMLLKFLSGPQPYSTYLFQKCLPKLPVPSLDSTLDRTCDLSFKCSADTRSIFSKVNPQIEGWLQVCKPLLNEEDYKVTQDQVESFRRNEGPLLQKHLLEKEKATDSWIHDYWLNGVYLSSRQPLVVNSNISGQLVVPEYKTTDPLARAAVVTSVIAKFHRLLENEEIPPVMLLDTVPLCMSGYKYLFNTVRVPGEHIDEVARHPGYSHIIVIRKGHYFKIDLQYEDGTLLTSEEIKFLLQEICKTADGLQEETPIAALTGQRRELWAKQRKQLMEKNSTTVKDVETSVFILCISDLKPKDFEESAWMCMTGSLHNVWFDKSFCYTVYGDGTVVAANADHTSYDAVVPSTLVDYILVFEEYKDGDVKKTASGPRALPTPHRLMWDVSALKTEISVAAKQLSNTAADIDLKLYTAKYGKGFMKKCRVSPDGYIQMIIQLAYYKLHREFTRTYEPATLRFFYLGRTETVNPISEASVDWVKSMCENSTTKQARRDLLVKAINYQTTYRLNATVGNGCDRHLFALMCASRELEMELPKIFADKAWYMPYKLSTSQTPTKMVEYDADCSYTASVWGFGPSCHDGYAISYAILGNDILNFHIVSYRSCATTSSAKLLHSIEDAMGQMKDLFDVS